jgi:hypothetical protein
MDMGLRVSKECVEEGEEELRSFLQGIDLKKEFVLPRVVLFA